MTPVEFGILKLLMENPGRVFSSSQIYEHVWKEPPYDAAKIISVHIRHLREKIERDPKNPGYLKVAYGLGYKIVKE